MNRCRRCGEGYPATPHQIKKHDFACVPCRRAIMREYRAARKAAGRPVVSGRQPQEYFRDYERQYKERPGVKADRAARMRRYSKDPALRPRHEARWLVRRALQSGRLTRQPCEACGSPKVHGHHDDYAQPLVVRWLCPTHHAELHAKAEGRP